MKTILSPPDLLDQVTRLFLQPVCLSGPTAQIKEYPLGLRDSDEGGTSRKDMPAELSFESASMHLTYLSIKAKRRSWCGSGIPAAIIAAGMPLPHSEFSAEGKKYLCLRIVRLALAIRTNAI